MSLSPEIAPASEDAWACFARLPRKAQVILQAVAAHYDVDDAKIIDRIRVKTMAEARHAACFLLRDNGYTSSEVGRMLNRDHSTIVHNIARGRLLPVPVLDAIRDNIASYVWPQPLPPEKVLANVRRWAERMLPGPAGVAALSYVELVLLGAGGSHPAHPTNGLMVLASTPGLQRSLADVLRRCGRVDTVGRLNREVEKSGWGSEL